MVARTLALLAVMSFGAGIYFLAVGQDGAGGGMMVSMLTLLFLAMFAQANEV